MKQIFTSCMQDGGKCKISGPVRWRDASSKWHFRTAELRQGVLMIYKSESAVLDLKLSLRQMRLHPCKKPRTFCLTRGQGLAVATIQTRSEEEYRLWIKAIASELTSSSQCQVAQWFNRIPVRKDQRNFCCTRNDERNLCCAREEEQGGFCCVKDEDDIPFVQGVSKYPEKHFRFLPKVTLNKEFTAAHAPIRNLQESGRIRGYFKEGLKRISERNERVQENNCCNVRQTIADPSHEPKNNKEKTKDTSEKKKARLKRGHKTRPVLPQGGDWKTQRVKHECREVKNPKSKHGADISNQKKNEGGCKESNKDLSDDSGVKSDDNSNAISDSSESSQKNPLENFTSVSVEEKKNFFELLSRGIRATPEQLGKLLSKNSDGDIKILDEVSSTLKRKKIALSLKLFNKTTKPVREIRRIFEPSDATQTGANEDGKGHKNDEDKKKAAELLNRRRLQRGERKLEKLKIQMAEVKDTIALIAYELKYLDRIISKRNEDLEAISSLQRRLKEENSRLDRLKEETLRVTQENQTILSKLENFDVN